MLGRWNFWDDLCSIAMQTFQGCGHWPVIFCGGVFWPQKPEVSTDEFFDAGICGEASGAKRWNVANYLTDFWVVVSNTPRKFNSLPPRNRQSQKEGLIFQPSFFRGELLNFGGVFFFMFTPKIGEDESILTHIFSDGLVQPPSRFQLPLWSLRVKPPEKLPGPNRKGSSSGVYHFFFTPC